MGHDCFILSPIIFYIIEEADNLTES